MGKTKTKTCRETAVDIVAWLRMEELLNEEEWTKLSPDQRDEIIGLISGKIYFTLWHNWRWRTFAIKCLMYAAGINLIFWLANWLSR